MKVTFTNIAPDDKEWSAHIRILNQWGQSDRVLRDILQYARSGPFYPADMHVNLIEQYILALVPEKPPVPNHTWLIGGSLYSLSAEWAIDQIKKNAGIENE